MIIEKQKPCKQITCEAPKLLLDLFRNSTVARGLRIEWQFTLLLPKKFSVLHCSRKTASIYLWVAPHSSAPSPPPKKGVGAGEIKDVKKTQMVSRKNHISSTQNVFLGDCSDTYCDIYKSRFIQNWTQSRVQRQSSGYNNLPRGLILPETLNSDCSNSCTLLVIATSVAATSASEVTPTNRDIANYPVYSHSVEPLALGITVLDFELSLEKALAKLPTALMWSDKRANKNCVLLTAGDATALSSFQLMTTETYFSTENRVAIFNHFL